MYLRTTLGIPRFRCPQFTKHYLDVNERRGFASICFVSFVSSERGSFEFIPCRLGCHAQFCRACGGAFMEPIRVHMVQTESSVRSVRTSGAHTRVMRSATAPRRSCRVSG